MSDISPRRLEYAVMAICPDIEKRVEEYRPKLNERCLWWELSCCVLSSQVPYSLAAAAADAIDRRGLLRDDGHESTSLASSIARILSEPLRVEGHNRRYRFPIARAEHLAKTRGAVTKSAGNLQGLLGILGNASEARSWLVANAPGLGPKQASMFLRNTGVSYDLAVLDRHVLGYMSALGIGKGSRHFISGLPRYRRQEALLKSYADRLGSRVGLLDWAIWIVMRVAQPSKARRAAA
jgi:N-glycosylase/DNA lyase